MQGRFGGPNFASAIGMAFISDPLVHLVIGAAIEVHKELGPGLLESTYSGCFRMELTDRRIPFGEQLWRPLFYKGRRLENGYRLDLLVEDRLIVEIKAVEKILPVHKAQLMTYLRLSGADQGLLFNFNEARLKDGIVSVMLRKSTSGGPSSPSASSTVEK